MILDPIFVLKIIFNRSKQAIEKIANSSWYCVQSVYSAFDSNNLINSKQGHEDRKCSSKSIDFEENKPVETGNNNDTD